MIEDQWLHVAAAAADIASAAVAYEDDPADINDSIQLMALLRDAKGVIDAFYKYIEQSVIERATEKRFEVEHIGEVEIKRRTKRTEWDSDRLTAHLVARALDERVLNQQTGEYEPAHEAVARVLSECARPSWRVTPLRARGIDETEYCHVEYDGANVVIPK